jgi:hypothetical protein
MERRPISKKRAIAASKHLTASATQPLKKTHHHLLKHTYTRQKTEHKHELSEMLHKQTWKFANREDISRASTIELYFHKFEGNTKL